jgi:hypothetical protein
MPCEPTLRSVRCASRPRTMTHRSPSPGESSCVDLRDERSLAPPRFGIRPTGTIRETAALKRPRASSRSHRHQSAQSSIPAPRGCYPIDWNALKWPRVRSRSGYRRAAQSSTPAPGECFPMNWDRLRLVQPLPEPTAQLFAIRGIRRRILHAGEDHLDFGILLQCFECVGARRVQQPILCLRFIDQSYYQ